jgi:hypothetical protein
MLAIHWASFRLADKPPVARVPKDGRVQLKVEPER